MVGRLACSLLLSSRPAPPPLLGSIRVCGGSWEGLGQVVVWALVGTPSPGPIQASSFLSSCTPLSRCIESRSGTAAFPAYYCTSTEQPSTSRADPVRARAPSRADLISCSQQSTAAQSAAEHSTAARNREAQIRSDARPTPSDLVIFAMGRKL